MTEVTDLPDIEHLRRRLADKDRVFRWLVDQLDDDALNRLRSYLEEHPLYGESDENL